MNHADHIALIREGVSGGTTWADLGSGSGAFTLALADLLGPGATIYSVDRDRTALAHQARALDARFPDVTVHHVAADFTQPLQLPALDGVVMANSLHFVPEKPPVLEQVKGYLRDGGRFVLVEYGADNGNPWVPFPISFETWRSLAERVGFRETRQIATVPSRFLGSMYAALSLR